LSGSEPSIHYNLDMQAGRELDAELIDASRRGDHNAFAQIVERYQRAVYAVSLSHVHDRALCDDITQDTFVTAWRQLDELRDPERLPAYLCGIARNLARDARKRRRFEGDMPERETAANGTPFESLSNAESDRLLSLALDAVPAKYREPLVLFYFEQRGADDIARVLGISEATAHQRLSRGRKHLAEQMTSLVEQGLSRRGPKPELVVAVLAAIAILAPASHVDARPVAKGPQAPALPGRAAPPPAARSQSTMLRKPIIIALCTLTLGTVAVSAGVNRSQSKSSAAPATKPATPATLPTAKPAAKAAAPAPTRTIPVGSPATPRITAAAPASVPGCDAVTAHMMKLAFNKLDPKGQMQAEKRALINEKMTWALLDQCNRKAWSDNIRLCMLDADDFDRAQIDCSDEDSATADEVAALPPELQCTPLADHALAVENGPGGKYAAFRAKVEKKFPERLVKIEEVAKAWRDKTELECTERSWSVKHRTCVAASKTAVELTKCE